MEPVQTIKYISQHYRKFWEKDCGIENWRVFGELLKPEFPELTETQYGRMRSSKEPCPKLLIPVLRDSKVIARIEATLGLPGILQCSSEEQIDERISRVTAKSESESPRGLIDGGLIISNGVDIDEIGLCSNELGVVERLSGFLDRKNETLAQWQDLPRSGASLIAYVVAGQRALINGGENYLVLPFSSAANAYLHGKPPDPTDVPYDRALCSLKRLLELTPHATPQAILDRLIERGRTLFVLHPEVLEEEGRDRNSAMHKLVKAAEGRWSSRNKKCIPVMLVGTSSSDRRATDTWTANLSLEFSSEQDPERERFFELQWRRFCRYRGMERDAEAGSSRLKRGRRYYVSDTASSSWPSTLRIQAFFASNHKTFSYFDPTAGWARLAGMPLHDMPIDVQLHLFEAVHQLRSIPEPLKRQSQLRAIRWCSTAVYWLTTDAVIDLGKLKPRTTYDTFCSSINRQFVELEDVADDKHIFKMDLGLRAAVQDRWIHQAAYERACAHHHIAFRLFSSKDNKSLLGFEFPLQPHWGRSRLHFLAECIRHLIRTCDASSDPTVSARGTGETRWDESKFPEAPKKDLKGCNPRQVINYCFGQLFWRELNGQRDSTNQPNRKLSLQHGVYHLTAELLQLMSDGNQLGKPHWALKPEYVPRYLLEVAFAQLDLGDLKGSKSTFEDLIRRTLAEQGDPFDVIDYQLEFTVVLASMDDLEQTRQMLLDCQSRLNDLQSCHPASDPRIEQRLTRISARRAHLAYLEGNYEEALNECRFIEARAPDALVRDVAHVYISTLGAPDGEPSNLHVAMQVCVRQLFLNTSKGLHHEALGFRVALGHLFRKMALLEAAEEVLDGAYHDVLQYGCSERVYIAMLLEAGRILYYQGRYERAYAAYLRPCLVRARSRGYCRPAEQARRYAQYCLQALIKQVPDQGWPREQIGTRLKPNGDYLLGATGEKIDPLHSYDAAEVERWIPRLENREALFKEIALLN